MLAEMYLMDKEIKLAVNYLKLLKKAGILDEVTVNSTEVMINFEGFDDMSEEIKKLKREVTTYYTYFLKYEKYFNDRGLTGIPTEQLFMVVMRTHLELGVSKLAIVKSALEYKNLHVIYEEIQELGANYKPPFKFENKTTNVMDIHYEGLFWVYKLGKELVS